MEEEKAVAREASVVPEVPVKKGMSEETRGLVYTICSALSYTISLSMLRGITNYPEVSSDWSIAVKELTTVACVLPFIIVQWSRGRYRFPTWGVFGTLVLSGITCQAIGARNHLLAYAAIGLALATPLIQALQLIMSSIFGAVWLKERVTRTKLVALVLLIVAVWLLSGGNVSLDAQVAGRPIRLGLGLLLVTLTAFGYSSQLLMMRRVLRQPKTPDSEPGTLNANLYAPTTLAMVTVTGVGVLVCGGCLTVERGVDAWLAPPPICWLFALIAGFANMIGFYFQIESLRRLFVLKQTMIANVQTIALTLLGIVLYHEAFTWTIGLGVILVGAGVTLASLKN